MDDEPDIHDRLEQLEATVADQQQTIEQLTEQPAVGRRSVVASLLGAGAVGGLAGYGSQRSRAQSGPAGQVGTGEEPVDGFLWDLDVQNGAEFNGSDVTGVGAVEAEQAETDFLNIFRSGITPGIVSAEEIGDLSTTQIGGLRRFQATADVSTTSVEIFIRDPGDEPSLNYTRLLVVGREHDGTGFSSTEFLDELKYVVGDGTVSPDSPERGDPADRIYDFNTDGVSLEMSSETYDVLVIATGFRLGDRL